MASRPGPARPGQGPEGAPGAAGFRPPRSGRRAVFSPLPGPGSRGARLGPHWKPGLGCQSPGGAPAPLLRGGLRPPDHPPPGARFHSARAARERAPAPAQVPKVVSSSLLFSIQTPRFGQLGFGGFFHPRAWTTGPPRRLNRPPPEPPRATAPRSRRAAVAGPWWPRRALPRPTSRPRARASGSRGCSAIPPVFRYRFIYFYLEGQRKEARCSVSSLERRLIVRRLRGGCAEGAPSPARRPAPSPPRHSLGPIFSPGATALQAQVGAWSLERPGVPATPRSRLTPRHPCPSAPGPSPLLQRNQLRASGPGRGGRPGGSPGGRGGARAGSGRRRSRALPRAPRILPHVPPSAFQILKMFPPATEKCPNQL